MVCGIIWMRWTVPCVVVVFHLVEFYILMKRNKSSLLPIQIFNKKVKVDMDGILIKGPFGKSGQGNFFDYNGYDGVTELFIRSGKVVDSIGFTFTNDGKYKFHKIGGEGGGSTTVKLQTGEKITEVQGAYGSWFDSRVIIYINFGTSKGRKFGPYGSDPNSKIIGSQMKISGHFHVINCGKLVGIFGEATGYFVNSIGFYFQK